MEVTCRWRDYDGSEWLEILCRRYSALKSLADEYRKKHAKTWINPFVDGKWILTIKK